jgi:glycosyltransferase involved in cell wall biosynthesis
MNNILRKKNKIAFIATTPFFFSSQLLNQLKNLKMNNFEIHIITSNVSPYSKTLIKYFNTHFVNIERKINIFNDILALFKIIFHLKRLNISIVHSFTPKGGLLGMIAAFVCRIDLKIHTYTGQAWVTKNGIIKKIMIYCDKLINYLSDICLVDSESQKSFLIKNKIVKKKKIFCIGKGSIAGVDLNKFNKTKYIDKLKYIKNINGLSLSKLIITYVGRIHEEKGVFDLIRVFKNLSKKHQIFLIFLGPIDFQNKKSQIVFNKIIRTNHNIKYIKTKPNPELIISITDILCLPSYREGFGSTIIQAAAMGVPCLGSNIIGIKDAIINNQTGLLFNHKNEYDFKKKLEKLIIDKKLRAYLSKNSIAYVIKNYSSQNYEKKIINLYKNIRKTK